MIPPNKHYRTAKAETGIPQSKEGNSVKPSNRVSKQLVLVLALIIGHGFPPGAAGA